MKILKDLGKIIYLLILLSGYQIAYAQQSLAQQAFAIFEAHCIDCHGQFGAYADTLVLNHATLIEGKIVVPGQSAASELYMRLLGDTDNGAQMPLGQEPLDSEAIATIQRWIEAGAPDWSAIPKRKRNYITTEAILETIHSHVTSLADFDRPFARYFTLTHLYNAGAQDDNLRAYRNALAKLINSLSWGKRVRKPTPIDQKETIFYIDLRHYEWDSRSDPWYKIQQAYPYSINFTSSTYRTLCQETNCEVPFVRADWFIATASLPPLYHEILDLPKTDGELEAQLEVNVAANIKNAPGIRVWRAGFNESGVSRNNRVVERHESRYGAYWKSYDFAGNTGQQNIFNHPLNFTHGGGEVIFNLPNGLQAYYLYSAAGERLNAASINIVSNPGARDPVIRNGLSCMGCHTEGMKTFEDQVRSVIAQIPNPSYDKAQALRLYAEKSDMDSLLREDIDRYKQAIATAGGVFGGSEPIQQLVRQFESPLDAVHAAAEVGLEAASFLKKIRENSRLQNSGLMILGVEKGSIKRDAWESQFEEVVSVLNLSELEVTFELIEGMKFANGTKVHSIAKSDIEALRDLPILIGEEEDQIDGITLINDKDEKIHVRTCREYESAWEQGYFGGPSNASLKTSMWFGNQCDLLKALQIATTPHKSFISSPRVGAANLELFPYSLFPPIIGEEPESRELNATYQSKVKDGVLIVKNVSQNLLRLEGAGMGQELAEMVRADFNNDGIEDILFFEWDYAPLGTFGYRAICILTRTSMDGKFEEVYSHE